MFIISIGKHIMNFCTRIAGVIDPLMGNYPLNTTSDFWDILWYYNVKFITVKADSPGVVTVKLSSSYYNWYNFVNKANLKRCKQTLDSLRPINVYVQYVESNFSRSFKHE